MNAAHRRIVFRIQYDGAAFAGSQWQPAQPTVQGALEEAVEALTGRPHRVTLAGRTDAGVHAVGQVAALSTTSGLPLERWQGGLNHALPPGVAVQAVREAPAGFDPRRWAIDRTYRYDVRVASTPQPLWRRRAWVVRGPLNEQRMAEALALLLGRHDFAAFAGRPARGGTERTLYAVRLQPQGGIWRFWVRADAFLPHQIRRTVGQLVEVGRGRATLEDVRRLLAEPESGQAGPAAPAQGLTLVRVGYAVRELAGWDDDNENLCREAV